MKKRILLLFTVLLIVYVLLRIKFPCKNTQAIRYRLENKNYCLRVADSTEEWRKGLMNIRKPVDYDGMLFVFPEKQPRTFWNKNTYLDLEIYWIDGEQIVGKDELPSVLQTRKVVMVSSGREVDRVVEVIK